MDSNDMERTENSTELDGPRAAKQSQTPRGKQSWIYDTFKKRTCSQFIRSEEDSRRCCCGRLETDHQSQTKTPTTDVKWEVDKHTKPDGSTDAYGELEFSGAGLLSRAKFIRVSHDTDPEDVLSLLNEEWKLQLPNLVISVTGGAKNFAMHPKLKYLFRQGLLKVAQTTGAWIITGGTNTGVNRHVGKAIKGHTVMSRGAQLKDKTSQVPLIGIATWGIVDHRKNLIDSKGVVTYHMTSSLESKGSLIDNNHSHFILVDDGTEGIFGDAKLQLRTKLLNCLAASRIPRKQGHSKETSLDNTSYRIPVVLLVLEGGPKTIRTVLESVTSNPAVPIVVAKGSGRAADILAYAHDLDGAKMKDMPEVVEHEILHMRIKKVFPECSEEKSREIYRDVLKCVENKKYVTICHMDEDGIDIDRAILRGLLKAQFTSPTDQLSLALTWNRADIARAEIFTKNKKWELKVLEEAMKDALVTDRVEFVNLLLENGVSMKTFLTKARLVDLYKTKTEEGSPSKVFLEEIIGKDKFQIDTLSLSLVKDVQQKMLGGIQYFDESLNQLKDTDPVPNPFNELLLWSVFCNMQQMPLFMWERGDENMARALVAGKLYNVMAKRTELDDAMADVTDELKEHADEFKRLSLGYLDQCHRTNEELTQQLLTYNLSNSCGQNCLSLAYSIQHEEFLAHVSCQTLLTEIWTGMMKTSQSSLKTILGLLFPPAILFLEFHPEPHPTSSQEDKKIGQDNNAFKSSQADIKENRNIESSNRSSQHAFHRTLSCLWTQEIPKRRLGCGRRIVEFYKAPAAKFWANAFDYMVFLALFCYVILVRQDKIPSNSEIVLIIFVSTLCTEEIRQILHSESLLLRNKFIEWGSNKWNLLDGFAVISFFVGLGLRLHPTTRGIGHVVYCLDVVLWIMRLLDIFSVSKHMGPYVVMIGRMAVDLMYFLFIMVVFVLAYGVAQQAILFPQLELPSWSMASRVFFRPYFQAHGELFVEAPDLIANTTTIFGTPRNDPFGDTVVSFMMAFYLLVVNILLLNLLIAIFNNTYEKVQANTNQIWKYNRYYLVMEYEQRPVLVPPFIIVNHVIYAIMFLFRCLRNRRQRRGNDQVDSNNGPRKNYDLKMRVFEERCVDDFLSEKDTLLHTSQEEKTKVIGERMESVSCQLQDMYKETISQLKALNAQLNRLEEDLKRRDKQLNLADAKTCIFSRL